MSPSPKRLERRARLPCTSQKSEGLPRGQLVEIGQALNLLEGMFTSGQVAGPHDGAISGGKKLTNHHGAGPVEAGTICPDDFDTCVE